MANSLLAAILSFFVPGLGQFYAGDLSKALGIFILFIVLLLVVHIIFNDWIYRLINLLYSLYAAYDAYQMAKYN